MVQNTEVPVSPFCEWKVEEGGGEREERGRRKRKRDEKKKEEGFLHIQP